MRKLLASALLLAALAALLAGGAVAASPVYVARQCQTPAIKPASVILACGDGNLYTTGLRYSDYGRSKATAIGLVHQNDCTPNCAAGKFHVYKGKLVFSKIERCGGRLFYTEAAYSFRGPYGKGTADVAPIGARCKKA